MSESFMTYADKSQIFLIPPEILICLVILQVVYMGMVGSFPFNSFLSGVLSCVGTAVLAGEVLN